MTLKRNHYVSAFNKRNPLNATRPGTHLCDPLFLVSALSLSLTLM